MLPWRNSKQPYIFESKENGFYVSFPKKPEVERQFNVDIYKTGKDDVGYVILVSNHGFTTVKDYDEAIELERNPAKLREVQREELQKGLDTLPNTVDRIMTINNKGTFLDVPCADVSYVNSDTYNLGKRFYIGDKSFQIIVGHHGHDKGIAESKFKQFVESFNLINE